MRCRMAVLLALMGLSGCGLFGNRQDPNTILNYATPNAGCLDNIGKQVVQYSGGQISTPEWTGAWDCVSSSLTLFAQFIRGSVPDGYTPQDIQVFMSHFLFSQAPISKDLVQSAFALKASVFGGTVDVITFDEVNKLLSLIKVLKIETTRILPYLASRTQNPTPENLLLLSSTIQLAGKNIAAALHTSGNATFTLAQIQTLVVELQSILTTPSGDIGTIGQLVTAIKQVLAQGGSDGIEGSAWPKLLQSLASYVGPVLSAMSYSPAFATGINPQGGLLIADFGQLIAALDATIQNNGGSIPFSALSNVIQLLPDYVLTATQRTAISNAQGMIFSHFLQSKTADAIDQNMTAYLMQQVAFWNRVQTTLEMIYTQNGFDPQQGVSAAQLTAALKAYSTDLDSEGKADVQWITDLIQNYKPYFSGDDSEVTFSPLELYSLHDMSMKHLIRLISSALLAGYSTVTDKTHINTTDFGKFVGDLTPVLAAFQMTDASIPNAAQARFLQANLFMPSSNGDGFVDLNEGSQYILYYLSISHLSQRVLPVVSAVCPSHGVDPYGAPLMDAACFRKTFFSDYLELWDRMPLMTRYFQSLKAADQASFEVSIETAARQYGYSSQCVGRYDIDGFTGILHYIETILQRFDTNGDGNLDTKETVAAFPVFQNELITVGQSHGLSATDTGQQKAVFAYALAHGALPATNFWGDVEFLWWWLVLGQDGWEVKADRTALYKVIASISPPPPPPATSQCQ